MMTTTQASALGAEELYRLSDLRKRQVRWGPARSGGWPT